MGAREQSQLDSIIRTLAFGPVERVVERGAGVYVDADPVTCSDEASAAAALGKLGTKPNSSCYAAA